MTTHIGTASLSLGEDQLDPLNPENPFFEPISRLFATTPDIMGAEGGEEKGEGGGGGLAMPPFFRYLSRDEQLIAAHEALQVLTSDTQSASTSTQPNSDVSPEPAPRVLNYLKGRLELDDKEALDLARWVMEGTGMAAGEEIVTTNSNANGPATPTNCLVRYDLS